MERCRQKNLAGQGRAGEAASGELSRKNLEARRPYWPSFGTLISLAKPPVGGFGIYTISREKHRLVEIYYSMGCPGEGPSKVFEHPKPPVRCRCKV
jgi:hypothetical protein